MLLKRAKMNQIALQGEGWDTMGNLLLRGGGSLVDGVPDPGQNGLNLLGKAGDILINIPGRDARFFHKSRLPSRLQWRNQSFEIFNPLSSLMAGTLAIIGQGPRGTRLEKTLAAFGGVNF